MCAAFKLFSRRQSFGHLQFYETRQVLKYRIFGNTGLKVSEIGFGCARLGGVFAENGSTDEALTVLRKALDEGINFYDTADMYSQGEAETLLGEAFRSQRDKVVLAT